ncbi:MAG TPA: phosphatase PAP2 family protein [Gemmatimonadales bacterium]|nr:phosphatase PAP2 family protein [Gemmatimonadales bacterium]
MPAGSPAAPPGRARRVLAGYWVLLIAVSVVLLVILSKFASEVVEGELAGFDQALRGWVLRHRSPDSTRAFGVLTLFASLQASLLFAAAAAVWLWTRKHRVAAAIFACAPVLTTVLFVAIKQYTARQRPPGAAAILTSYSFPSGHMTSATGLWAALMYLLWREGLLPLLPALLIGLGWPFLVGLSRIYLDVHWASDVAAGWLLGLALALVAAAGYERWRARRPVTSKEEVPA